MPSLGSIDRQATLFDMSHPDLPPIAHAGDPSTSHAAARKHEASGKRARHAQTVLGLVGRFPGKTAAELWELANDWERTRLVELQEIRRRLTDLLASGAVRQGEQRPCTVRGSAMVTWFVAGAEA